MTNNNINILTDLTNKYDSSVKCKGLRFRGIRNAYSTKDGGIVQKVGIRLLKKQSCTGCESESCENNWLLDSMNEMPESVDLSKVKDGKTYHIAIENISYDYETGYADDWDMVAIESVDLSKVKDGKTYHIAIENICHDGND